MPIIIEEVPEPAESFAAAGRGVRARRVGALALLAASCLIVAWIAAPWPVALALTLAAIVKFSEAIGLAPQFALAYYERGSTCYEEGELDKAIADFDEAIRLSPGNARAYYYRGCAYKRKGERLKAADDDAKAKRLGLKVGRN